MAEYDVFTRINEHYAKMSKGHKAIADYISEHYDQAVFMTAAKLGETLGISEAACRESSTAFRKWMPNTAEAPSRRS